MANRNTTQERNSKRIALVQMVLNNWSYYNAARAVKMAHVTARFIMEDFHDAGGYLIIESKLNEDANKNILREINRKKAIEAHKIGRRLDY